MNLIETLIEPLGWTLLHFIWQGLLIGLLHEIAIRMAAKRSPELRYCLSLGALILLIAVPMATFAALWPDTPSVEPVAVASSGTAVTAIAAAAAAPELALRDYVNLVLPYLVIGWLAGVMLLSARFGLGLLALRRLARGADFDAVSDWVVEELQRLRERMGIGRKVRVALSAQVDTPLIVGWFRPLIFLPLSAATGLSHQQIRMVLAHELAHLRRHDHLVNLLQVMVETLLFYHPAVHRVSLSLRQEREQCCDDMAAAIGGNRIAYARVLAELEQMRQDHVARMLHLGLGIADQELYARIERLVAARHGEARPERGLPVILIALAGMMMAAGQVNLDAPLLPSFDDDSHARQRIALPLPPPVSRDFVPIENPKTAVVTEAPPAIQSSLRDDAGTRPVVEKVARTVPTPVKQLDAKASDGTVSERLSATPPAADVDTTGTSVAADKSEPVAAVPTRSGGELLRTVKPIYPRSALREGIEGEVLLEFTITPEGRVDDLRILEAEPQGTFENAAAEAIRQWQYSPFIEDGTAVTKRVTQVVEFRLAELNSGRNADVGRCLKETGSRLCRPVRAGDTRVTTLSR